LPLRAAGLRNSIVAEPKIDETTGDKTNGSAQAAAAAELRGRIDQVGAILAKGLDLAEAGLSLGATIVSRVGAVAQEKLLERVAAAAASAAATGVAEPGQAPAPAPAASPSAAPVSGVGITNRLPLTPGGSVRISFSINNESAIASKTVALALEGFVGDTTGRSIDAAGFVVKPAKKAIEPMDFEKFVLEGAVPADAPPDIYRGFVVVASDGELRIPVWLAVTAL
jgi:hypothetical protein